MFWVAATVIEQRNNLWAAVNLGPVFVLANPGQEGNQVVHRAVQDVPIEKTQAADRHIERAWGELFALVEKQQVIAELVVAETLG